MKKLLSACGVLALAIGLVVAPGALAKSGVKTVGGTVSVSVTPNPAVTGTPMTASGNVSSNSSCRKNRSVLVELLDGTSVVASAPAVTRSNGDYTATLTAPAPGTYTLRVTVAQADRKFASKRKGKKPKRGRTNFDCTSLTGTLAPVAVNAPAP